VPEPAPFATVTSSFGATSSVSIEQIESSEGVPFRRDLDSVVAQNIPTLMKTETNSGIPGFEAFAEAVSQGLANGKRDLAKLFTRGLVARDLEADDSAECGGRLSCSGQGQGGISTRESQTPDCGGRLSCFKKRDVDALKIFTRESQTPDCGGRLSCFKKRVVDALKIFTRESQTPDCGGRLSCFKKRIVDALKISTRESQTPDCGGRLSCFKKRTVAAVKISTRGTQKSTAGCIVHGSMSCLKERIVDNSQLKRLLKHLPAASTSKSITKRSAAAEPEAMYDPPSLIAREPVAEPQTFHTCDGGLCYGTEDKVEKRAVEVSTVKPRDATPESQTGAPGGHSCGRFECMEESTVDSTVKPRDSAPEPQGAVTAGGTAFGGTGGLTCGRFECMEK